MSFVTIVLTDFLAYDSAIHQLKQTVLNEPLDTMGCPYNAIQYNKTMYTAFQQQRQSINQGLHSQNTPHSLLDGRAMGCLL